MLAKLEGYAAALLGSLDATALATVAADLTRLEQTILGRSDLRAVLSDTSIAGVARGRILHDLLDGKLDETTLRLAVYAATAAPAQEVDHSIAELAVAAQVLQATGEFVHATLGLLAARKRVGGFADALLEGLDAGDFAQIEGDLFSWARAVEENQDLRRLLLDRDAALEARVGLTKQLLANKVSPVTLRLACYVIEGGRPRDVVGTLDFLVDYVAKARNWRVARVYTARALDESSQSELVGSLTSLTGGNVELQIAEDPALLGGVLVEVGDLRLDATTRGRLGALHDAVASGRLYESAFNRND
jgi:F-type H+-transporting ATPase subunit delta